MLTSSRIRPGTRRARVTTRLAPVAAAALLLAACGPADAGPSEGVLSLEEAGATAEAGAEAGAGGLAEGISEEGRKLEAPTDMDQAMALYDTCMKDQGFGALGAPESGSVELPDLPDAENGEDPMEKFDESDATCRGHLRNIDAQALDVSPEQQAAIADAERAMVTCMSDKGYDVSSLYGRKGGVGVDGGPGSEQSDEAELPYGDPTFEEAMQACTAAYDSALDRVFGGDQAGENS